MRALLAVVLLAAGCATAGPGGGGAPAQRLPTAAELARVARAVKPIVSATTLNVTPTCKGQVAIAPDEAIQAGVMTRDEPGCPGRLYIMVSTGALQALDDAQLRGILAHEIGHVVLGHQAAQDQRRAVEATAQGAAQVVSAVASAIPGLPGAIAQIAALVVSLGTPVVARGFDREQERDADRWAVGALQRQGGLTACLGLSSAFERLARSDRGGPSILDTHPQASERAGDVRRACGGA